MRRIKVILFVMLLVLALPLTASATEGTDAWGEEYKEMMEALPEDISGLLPEKLFSDNVGDIAEGAKKAVSFGYVVEAAVELLGLKTKEALKLLSSLMGVLILAAVMNSVKSSFSSTGLVSVFSVVVSCGAFLVAVGAQYGIIRSVAEFFSRLCMFANAFLPLSGALYAMGGNVASAVVHHSSLSIFITVVENLCGKTVIPVAGVCIAFAAVNVVAPEIGLGGLAGFFKRSYTTVLGFLMTVFVTVMSAQSLLASRTDSLSGRAARFAVGNLIPMVGSSLSGTLGTVSTGIEYIRAAVGTVGIATILLMLMPTLITLLLTKLVFSMLMGAADILGCAAEKKLISEMSSINGFLLASAAICSVCFIFILAIFARCASAAGGGL